MKNEEKKNQKQNFKKGLRIGGVSLLAIVIAISFYCCGKKHGSNKGNTSSSYSQSALAPYDNVFDENQVTLRADAIYDEIMKINSEFLIQEEDIEKDIKWFGAGAISEPTIAEALNSINNVELLMNVELLPALNYYHDKAETISNKKVLDFSIYVEDDKVRSKNLINKIYKVRKGMVEAQTHEEAQKYAQEFTTLMGDSWFANGYNNEINVKMLETSGYSALAMKYFLNTAGLAHAIDENLTYVCPPQTDKEAIISLKNMIKQLNKAKCMPDGQYVNDFSEAMNGMIIEAQYHAKNKDCSLILSKRG